MWTYSCCLGPTRLVVYHRSAEFFVCGASTLPTYERNFGVTSVYRPIQRVPLRLARPNVDSCGVLVQVCAYSLWTAGILMVNSWSQNKHFFLRRTPRLRLRLCGAPYCTSSYAVSCAMGLNGSSTCSDVRVTYEAPSYLYHTHRKIFIPSKF